MGQVGHGSFLTVKARTLSSGPAVLDGAALSHFSSRSGTSGTSEVGPGVRDALRVLIVVARIVASRSHELGEPVPLVVARFCGCSITRPGSEFVARSRSNRPVPVTADRLERVEAEDGVIRAVRDAFEVAVHPVRELLAIGGDYGVPFGTE